MTPSQSRAHFLRQVKGLAQVRHSFCGRSDFLRIAMFRKWRIASKGQMRHLCIKRQAHLSIDKDRQGRNLEREGDKSMRNRIARAVSSVIISKGLKGLRQRSLAARRRMSGKRAQVLYFHQPDDPYSQLTAQILSEFQARYDVDLEVHLVDAPADDVAPERAALEAYSRRDAAKIAPFYGLSFTDTGAQPSQASLAFARRTLAASSNLVVAAEQIGAAYWADDTDRLDRTAMVSDDQTEKIFAAGVKKREALGHYLGATFYFEGEWYWGVDRLPYLEERLSRQRLRHAGCKPVTQFQTRPDFMSQPSNGRRLTVEFYPSARSPYTALSMQETLDLPNHYPITLRIRPVLPMVMRNLPVPMRKRLYIMRDSKREADRIGVAFGKIFDPVGDPVRRVYSLFAWAETQGKGGALLHEFSKMAWAEGINAGSDDGLKQACTRAALDWETAQDIVDNKDWEAWAEENRLQMMASDLWGVPSFRLLDEDGTELFSCWGRDRLWLLAHEIQSALEA